MSKRFDKISKFLSFVLRHKPESIGLTLNSDGWVVIEELIAKANMTEPSITLDYESIIETVNNNDKKRFTISEDELRIRANQGHSIKVNLGLTPTQPPDILYHGTATRFLDSILKEGLKAGARQHVHLSTDIDTATQVGQRYGKPVILKINAHAMFKQGHEFYVSDNDVWLTDYISPSLLTID